ncbi:MAG: ATP-binding protein [Anderseniella sp.]
MTKVTAPSLDDLNHSTVPAWLWDGARMRIVWANSAGVSFFGHQSLFDLIDTPFDDTDPGVARVRELATSVMRGESWQEVISFASAASEEPVSVNLYVHSLADGRNGLLMVTHTNHEMAVQSSYAEKGVLPSVLEGLPVATLVVTGDSQITFANDAARKLIGGDQPSSVSELGIADTVLGLINKSTRAGIATAIAEVPTAYGSREVRITVKPLSGSDHVMVVLEDVTDRRLLERSQQTVQATPTPISTATVKTAVQPSETGKSGTLSGLKQAIEAVINTTGEPLEDRDALHATTSTAKPAAKPEQRQNREPAEKSRSNFNVAEIVHNSLSRLPRAIVLYRAGKIVYANQAVALALGYADENEITHRHDIAAALGTLAGKDGRIILTSASDADVEFMVHKSTFPWNDGAIPMAVLSQPSPAGKTSEPRTNDKPEIITAPALEPGTSTDAQAKPDNKMAVDLPSAEPAPAGVGPVSAAAVLSILDTASDGFVFLSTSGNITHMSAGAEALFGVHAASVLDTPLAGLMNKASSKIIRDYVSALDDSGLSMVFNGGREVTAKMNDGGDVPLFITMRKVSEQVNGVPKSAYCAVLRDITQWKKTEAELREARDKAENTSRQKSEFLARISHELRTPLNAILGFSDVMRKGQFGKLGSERYEGYANDIHTSGEYLLSLVNDLLDLSKVEAGKLELNFISVDLGQSVDACIKLMQDEATGARVVLRTSIAPNLPHVVADNRSIKQVLLNLVGNAIKFTDPGGQVIISAKALASGELMLSVADTGVGMNEDQLNKALEPFHRVETTGRPDVQGTGLGLPLTKALVEANRANFEITSEPRKGTRVDITFPTTRVLAS